MRHSYDVQREITTSDVSTSADLGVSWPSHVVGGPDQSQPGGFSSPGLADPADWRGSPGRTSQHEIPPAVWPMKRRAPDGERDVASADAEHASTVSRELPGLFHSRTRSSPPLVTIR